MATSIRGCGHTTEDLSPEEWADHEAAAFTPVSCEPYDADAEDTDEDDVEYDIPDEDGEQAYLRYLEGGWHGGYYDYR